MARPAPRGAGFSLMKITSLFAILLLFTGKASARPWPRTFEEVPLLDQTCTTEEERSRTVTILGSSRDSDGLKPYADSAHSLARRLVAMGYHVLTGSGNKGIMRAAFDGAALGARSPGKPGENRVILVKPPWQEPDLVNSRAIGCGDSEAHRIELFRRCSKTFVVFPGGAVTMQEITSLVAFNRYVDDPGQRLRILLVDAGFYASLVAQYREQERLGTLGIPLDGLFELLETGKDPFDRVVR